VGPAGVDVVRVSNASIRMNAHTASFRAAGALLFQWALGTRLSGKVNHSTGNKGHLLCSRTAPHLPFPIEGKGLLVKVLADPNWPGEAQHFQLFAAFT
jgi:hypothetical protein